MCLIATATASWDGDDVSFGDGDEMCVSGAEATGGSSSLPGSSLLLPPDTPWLALTGTSRAGLAQPIHERARARKPNPAPALPSCQNFPQHLCFRAPAAAAAAAAAVDGNPSQPVSALVHLLLPELLLRHTLDHHLDHIC